ncbi:hypothetical protein C8R45DRAFT_1011186 [Mycena sanguinolenta]|nr:hypothetical protein C8R45DRAFT_1011186 [Mycena sanguinolenta]
MRRHQYGASCVLEPESLPPRRCPHPIQSSSVLRVPSPISTHISFAFHRLCSISLSVPLSRTPIHVASPPCSLSSSFPSTPCAYRPATPLFDIFSPPPPPLLHHGPRRCVSLHCLHPLSRLSLHSSSRLSSIVLRLALFREVTDSDDRSVLAARDLPCHRLYLQYKRWCLPGAPKLLFQARSPLFASRLCCAGVSSQLGQLQQHFSRSCTAANPINSRPRMLCDSRVTWHVALDRSHSPESSPVLMLLVRPPRDAPSSWLSFSRPRPRSRSTLVPSSCPPTSPWMAIDYFSTVGPSGVFPGEKGFVVRRRWVGVLYLLSTLPNPRLRHRHPSSAGRSPPHDLPLSTTTNFRVLSALASTRPCAWYKATASHPCAAHAFSIIGGACSPHSARVPEIRMAVQKFVIFPRRNHQFPYMVLAPSVSDEVTTNFCTMI